MSLKLLIFLGSVRKSSPPAPPRLGERAARACHAMLGGEDATLVDPLELPNEAVFTPHFSYRRGEAPPELDGLAEAISAADGYVMVSPEYNHAMSPALAGLLNHFGSSRFAFKPSAIVTYSAGQWGGTRAAVNMRTFLGELGCLPVSAMIHIPKAQEVLDAGGAFLPEVDAEAWRSYFGRTFKQLTWWAKAAASMRTEQDPARLSPAFKRQPAQRNAP